MNESEPTSPSPDGGSGVPQTKPLAPNPASSGPEAIPMNPFQGGLDRRQSTQRVAAMIQEEQFSGPIPPPKLLAHYEEICPGAADRIIALAEREQQFGHKITEAALNAESSQSKRGTFAGVIVAVSAFATSVLLAWVGAEVAAAIVGGSTVVSLVTAFLVGHRTPQQATKKEEPETKQPTASPSGKKSGKGKKRS